MELITRYNGSRPYYVHIKNGIVKAYIKTESNYDHYGNSDDESLEQNPQDESFYLQWSSLLIHGNDHNLETESESESCFENESDSDSESHNENRHIFETQQIIEYDEEIESYEYTILCFSCMYTNIWTTNNSCLIQIRNNEYVFIGKNIIKLQTLSPIVYFESKLCYSDAYYSWAKDSSNNYYLFNEHVILINIEDTLLDPYKYYFENYVICDIQESLCEFDIKRFFCGMEEYILTWSVDPAYDYERLTNNHLNLVIVSKFNEIKFLNRSTWFELHEKFGLYKGFQSMNHTIVHDMP